MQLLIQTKSYIPHFSLREIYKIDQMQPFFTYSSLYIQKAEESEAVKQKWPQLINNHYFCKKANPILF